MVNIMSKKEESVFEELNRHLSEISEKLEVANEALIVIATELYEAKRDFTILVREMNTVLGKLAKTGVNTEVKEVSVVQDAERFKEAVLMPKSTLPKKESAEK